MCVGSIDSQAAEWILMKLFRHDPWVGIIVFTKTFFENVTPGGGKKEFKFSIKRP